MPMKLAQLPLHLTPDEALTLIDFLGQIQDLLWAQYDQVIRTARMTHQVQPPTQRAREPDFDDPLPPF